MKTPFQELKEHIEQMINHGGDPDLICVLGLINSEYIIKEKSCIIEAVNEAIHETNLYESFRHLKSGEQYYQENFES